ncbi:transposase [Pseudomonas purpurea]|uniref:transposase n=1 Tax=Pseudomonas purpurea TaxID=3136737 RepID=UPI003266CDE0
MRLLTLFLMLCAAVVQGGCVRPPSDYKSLDPGAILSNEPQPRPGINQRPVTGTKKVLLVVGQWTGQPALDKDLLWKQSLAPAEKTSLRSYITDVSGGKLTLEGRMITVALGAKPANCDNLDEVTRPAERAVREQSNLEPDDYDYLFIAAYCNGTTLSSARTSGRTLGIYHQPANANTWIHRFGNNLGFLQAFTYSACPVSGDSVEAPGRCKTIDATDYGDPVSGGTDALYPANYRWYAGWLDDTQVARVQHSGFYRLAALGTAGPQTYLIDRSGGGPKQIAVEVRQPGQTWDKFPAGDNRVKGVWTRYTDMGTYAQNFQVDGTPLTLSTIDPTLTAKKQLVDQAAGITVKVCTVSEGFGATLSVGIKGETPPDCSSSKLPKPVVTSHSNGDVVGPIPIFGGTSLPGAVIIVTAYKGSEPVVAGGGVANAKGEWSVKLTKPLPSGPYRVTVSQTMATVLSQFSDPLSITVR